MHYFWTALFGAIAAAWIVQATRATLGMARVPELTDSAPIADAKAPSISVIFAARDEAEKLSSALATLLAQDYPRYEVIAVNDRSTDATGAIMEALARAHAGRLEALQVAELPAGWLGKTHAMVCAARRAIGEYRPEILLFTDGDVVFREDAIRRALAQVETTRADHLILMPTLVARSHSEAMMLAYVQTMSMWAARSWRAADPKALDDAFGVGAFNLIRTGAYEQLGGYEATPMEVLEDLMLGRRVKRAGLRQRVATGPGMVRVHWAPGVGGLVRGLTKNIFAVFGYRTARLLAAAAGVLLISVAPVGFLALRATRIPALLSLAAVAGMYALSARSTRIPAWYAVFFPVAALITVYSMMRSMLVSLWRGGVTWRGTFYPLAELRRQRSDQP